MVARCTVLTLEVEACVPKWKICFRSWRRKLPGHYLRSHSHMSDATCGVRYERKSLHRSVVSETDPGESALLENTIESDLPFDDSISDSRHCESKPIRWRRARALRPRRGCSSTLVNLTLNLDLASNLRQPRIAYFSIDPLTTPARNHGEHSSLPEHAGRAHLRGARPAHQELPVAQDAPVGVATDATAKALLGVRSTSLWEQCI